MAIKQTIQYRISGVAVKGEWQNLPLNNILEPLGGVSYEFRVVDVYPVGYKFKSKWGGTIYEVIGDPVTNVSKCMGGEAEETTHYPVRAIEDDGREIWHEFEREDFILSREEVK